MTHSSLLAALILLAACSGADDGTDTADTDVGDTDINEDTDDTDDADDTDVADDTDDNDDTDDTTPPGDCATYGGYALGVGGADGLVSTSGYTFSDTPRAFTIELWLRPSSFPAGEGRILDWTQPKQKQEAYAARAFWVLDVYSDGRLQFESRAASSDSKVDPVPGHLETTSALVLDAWTHVALVVDESTSELRFYLNGVAAGVATPDPAWWTLGMDPVHGLYIGGRSSMRWVGGIDDVRFWSVARTPAEIRRDMCTRLTEDTAPDELVEQHAFDGTWETLSGTTMTTEGTPQHVVRP